MSLSPDLREEIKSNKKKFYFTSQETIELLTLSRNLNQNLNAVGEALRKTTETMISLKQKGANSEIICFVIDRIGTPQAHMALALQKQIVDAVALEELLKQNPSFVLNENVEIFKQMVDLAKQFREKNESVTEHKS